VNKKKSHEAKSGKYGEWGNNSYRNSINFAVAIADEWNGALLWWNNIFFLAK